MREYRVARVSVPSSSGCSLRHCPSKARIARTRQGFSPLFIGVLSAALGQQCHKLGLIVFQSPLHRGALCGDRRAPALPALDARFSPLFIGVLSAAAHEM